MHITCVYICSRCKYQINRLLSVNSAIMYALYLAQERHAFSDRFNPLDKYDSLEIKTLFHFERQNVTQIVNDLMYHIMHLTSRNKALSPYTNYV